MQDPLEADSSSLIRILTTHTLMLYTTRLFTVLEGILLSKWQMLGRWLSRPLLRCADITDGWRPSHLPALIQNPSEEPLQVATPEWSTLRCNLNWTWNWILFVIPVFPSHCLCSCCFLYQNAFPFLFSYPSPSESHPAFKVQLECQLLHGNPPGALLRILCLPCWLLLECSLRLLWSSLHICRNIWVLSHTAPHLVLLFIPCRTRNCMTLFRNSVCMCVCVGVGGFPWISASMEVIAWSCGVL